MLSSSFPVWVKTWVTPKLQKETTIKSCKNLEKSLDFSRFLARREGFEPPAFWSVAKKHGVNKMDFYADLAKAWLEDEDAVEDKAGKYFQYIVKH